MQGVGHAHRATSDSVDLELLRKQRSVRKNHKQIADAREWDLYRSAVVNEEEEIGQARFPDRIRSCDLRLSDNGAVCHARISDYCWMPEREREREREGLE